MNILFHAILLAMLGLASPAVAQEEAKAPVESPPSTPPPAKLGTTDDALKLARGLGEQHADQSDLRRIRKDYDRDRAAIKQAFDAHLASDFEPVPPTYELRGLSQKLTVFVSEVAGWRSELGERQRGLTRSRRELLDLTKQWQERLALEQQTGSPEALIERINNVLDAIKTSDGVVQSGLQEVLALDNELLDHEDELANLVKRLDEMLSDVRQGFFSSDAPPIWEVMSGEALMLGMRGDVITKERFDDETKSFWRIYERTFWFHLAFLGAMLVTMLALRRSDYVRKQEDLQVSFRVLGRPVSGAVLVYVFLLPLLYENAPILVLTMFRVLSLIPVVRLIPVFVTKPFRPTFYTVAALFALETVYDVLPDESGFSRLLLLLMTGVGLWGATGGARSLFAVESVQALPRLGFIRRLVNFVALLLALAVLTNAIGAAGFAGFLTEALLGSAYVALGLFVGNAVLADFIRLLLGSRTLRDVRAVALHRKLIFERVTRATRWAAVTAWVFLTLTALELVPGFLGFVTNLLKASVTIGSMELSVGGVGLFFLAIYLAVLLSRLVRFFLDADVLPRMQLPRGVPSAISTSVHYVVVGLGILIAASASGLDLSSLAIVVGALGVGIGFGLQNLVNNFVSGLILLFERPIQAGDTVQVGELTGIVHAIGIRASRVRTYNGSEVIVPNGDLTSSQVINWTLSDRSRRIEINVGVAYRYRPAEVVEVLEKVIAEQEDILKDPEPSVHFDGFGDSSLNFRVFVWALDYEHGLRTRTDVSSAIYDALAEANIEIPFPQRDLHLRSVDAEAGRLLAGPEGSGP